MKECCSDPSTILRNSARGYEQGVHVDPVGIDRQIGGLDVFVVNGDEHQIDVGLLPDDVVGEAAAEHRGQDRSVVLDVVDQRVEGGREPLADGLLVGGHDLIVDRALRRNQC